MNTLKKAAKMSKLYKKLCKVEELIDFEMFEINHRDKEDCAELYRLEAKQDKIFRKMENMNDKC